MYSVFKFINSYQTGSFISKLLLGQATQSDCITEFAKMLIDNSNMNQYDKECFKLSASEINYCLNRR